MFNNRDSFPMFQSSDFLARSQIIPLIFSLGVYAVLYHVFAALVGQSMSQLILEIVIFFFYILYIIYQYHKRPDNTVTDFLKAQVLEQLEVLDYGWTPFAAVLNLFALYILVYVLQIPMGWGEKAWIIVFTEIYLILCFWFSCIFVFFKYILGYDLAKRIVKEMNSKTNDKEDNDVDTNKKETKPVDKKKPVVFHVGPQMFTYEEANTVCSSYGARLANYDEMEAAYNNGSEFCEYGWNTDQMAFFPTQKSTWNLLQKHESTKNSCGRPGINGGWFSNPLMRFGANCYGIKPEPTAAELAKMRNHVPPPNPVTPQQKELEEKIKQWKTKQNDLLTVFGFNSSTW
jgi:predicted membrane protein